MMMITMMQGRAARYSCRNVPKKERKKKEKGKTGQFITNGRGKYKMDGVSFFFGAKPGKYGIKGTKLQQTHEIIIIIIILLLSLSLSLPLQYPFTGPRRL